MLSHNWLDVSILACPTRRDKAMRRHTVPWLLAAFLLTAASASADEVNDWDRFRLWNACRPVGLLVEGLSDDAGEIGLRQGDIETAVRSRLRGARIYAETGREYLYVRVIVVGPAHSIHVGLERHVEVWLPFWAKPEEMGPLAGFAATWDSGSAGIHGRTGAAFILSSVALHTDKFIDEYLRVNEDACK